MFLSCHHVQRSWIAQRAREAGVWRLLGKGSRNKPSIDNLATACGVKRSAGGIFRTQPPFRELIKPFNLLCWTAPLLSIFCRYLCVHAAACLSSLHDRKRVHAWICLWNYIIHTLLLNLFLLNFYFVSDLTAWTWTNILFKQQSITTWTIECRKSTELMEYAGHLILKLFILIVADDRNQALLTFSFEKSCRPWCPVFQFNDLITSMCSLPKKK
jgi:hypothetical protein